MWLSGLGNVYLKVEKGEANSKDGSKSSFQDYKSVLNSKSSEETLVIHVNSFCNKFTYLYWIPLTDVSRR